MARKVDKAKNEAMKKNIIEAAIQVVMEKGFSQFTISSIAKKLNVTKATIYWYFESKDELINTISERIWNEELENSKRIIESSASATEKLEQVINRKESITNCILPIKLSLEFVAVDNEVKTRIREGYQLFREILTDILLQGQKDGEFTLQSSAEDLAKFIISMLDGLIINYFTMDVNYNPLSLEQVMPILYSILHVKN